MSKRVLTTESGAPVADNQNSASAGIGGPLLLQDQHLLEKLARFNRERIPERVVHARGSGAYGYFEVTDDVTGFTQEGKTPTQQAILRSIATYRMTKDSARACALITSHFLSTTRFDGKLDNCEQVLRSADKHLPDSAKVQSVSGDSARVLVDEPTATKSIYEMKREGGVWKIDDITEAR